MRWFSSDWHLGHGNVIKFSDRPFQSTQEMNSTILKNMYAPLKKGDILYYLGDLSWSKSAYERAFDELPDGVTFVWILGNHDKRDWSQFKSRVEIITDLKEIKIGNNPITLCHYPMLTWNKSHFNSWMLYGHHHKKGHGDAGIVEKTVGKMLNINCEFNDYKPYSESDIIRIMNAKPDNWDYIKEEERCSYQKR